MGQVGSSGKRRASIRDGAHLSLLFQGARAAGRTTLAHRLTTGELLPDHWPLNNLHIDSLILDGLNLTVVDAGGRCSIRPILKLFQQRAHGLAFVIDANDPGSWDDAVDKLAFHAENLPGMPVAVLGNKCDLLGDRRAAATAALRDKLATDARLAPAMGNRPNRCFAVSAVTGEGVAEAANWLVQTALSSSAATSPPAPTTMERGSKAAADRATTAWAAWLHTSVKSALTR